MWAVDNIMAPGSSPSLENNPNDNNFATAEVEEDECNFVSALQIIESGSLSMVLKAVAELDVFGIMAKAGQGQDQGHQLFAKEIVDQLQPAVRNPNAASMLDRMLRLLATHSVVSCSVGPDSAGRVERRYGLAPLSKLFVEDENAVSLGPLLSFVTDSVMRTPWNKIKDALVEGGIPMSMVYGVRPFDYFAADPRLNEVFNKGMFNYSTLTMRKMLENYKGFDGIKQLVDVGGGLGHALRAIMSKYPTITGINFDLPHVVCNAQPSPGLKHVGGDMFESIPSGDAIFMKGVLHDWDDDHCLTLLKNCYKALPDYGKIIAMDVVLSEEPETSVFARAMSHMDVHMMVIGGKERTEEELLTLATAAGFASIKLVCRVYHYWMVEFFK